MFWFLVVSEPALLVEPLPAHLPNMQYVLLYMGSRHMDEPPRSRLAGWERGWSPIVRPRISAEKPRPARHSLPRRVMLAAGGRGP